MTFYRMGVVVAMVAAGIGWAAPAHAADAAAYESGAILNYTAATGVVNSVYIRQSGSVYTIDDVATIVPGLNCKWVSTDHTYVECQSAGITEIRVWTYDGNDLIDHLTPTFARLFGGDGNDTVWGGTGQDWLMGDNGNDWLNGWTGDDQVYWGAGADQMYGGTGWDIAFYDNAPYGVAVDLDGIADDGGSGEGDLVGTDIERLEGTVFNDWLVGNDIANELFGGGGSDVLLGQGGNDDIYGDLGAAGVLGADYMSGGAGTDRVFYSSHDAAHPIIADLDGASGDDGFSGEGDTIASDVESLGGGAGNDWIIGNSGPNALSGGDGDDIIVGYGGNDTLDGWVGNDYLLGGDGNDQIFGWTGNDYLYGENHSDTLNGGADTDHCEVGPGGTSVTACES